MEGEALVVNLFLVFRVMVVGGIFLVHPRITRKGLVFGVYVGEATASGERARSLLRRWSRGCVQVMVLSLLIGLGISLAGWPVAGNLTGTAVLLLGTVLLYCRLYRSARVLAPPAAARQARMASALLSADPSRGDAFAGFALAVCLLTGVSAAACATLSCEDLPERMPTAFSLLGITDGLSGRSLITVLFLPSPNLVLSSFFALLALLVARAKRSLRGCSGGVQSRLRTPSALPCSKPLAGWHSSSACSWVSSASRQSALRCRGLRRWGPTSSWPRAPWSCSCLRAWSASWSAMGRAVHCSRMAPRRRP